VINCNLDGKWISVFVSKGLFPHTVTPLVFAFLYDNVSGFGYNAYLILLIMSVCVFLTCLQVNPSQI